MRAGKRAFDMISAAVGLVILSPLFLAIAIAVKLDSAGPSFFRQERVGRGGEPFRIWKFRTMVADAERLGGVLTVGGDSRITPVGAFLRRYKLDELPQLLNVIIGEMSFVGPRPEVAKYVALYTREQKRVLDLMPGITDPASLEFRDEGAALAGRPDPERYYVAAVMPRKIALNLEYARQATLWSDVGIVLATVSSLGR